MRTIFLGLALFLNLGVQATTVPLYLAYSRAPEPTDITANAYGASRLAPDAFGIGEIFEPRRRHCAVTGNYHWQHCENSPR